MRKNKVAIAVIGLATLLMISPLLLNHQALYGVDGPFQYSRIYEAAMQLKNHNFSFMNLYTFQQAGRIVNSLYSPLVAVLCGILLLLVGNWFRFQIISLFIVYFLCGYFMYKAALKLRLSRKLAIALGVIFLSSNAVYGFLFGIMWRSLAVALLPIFIGPILDLYHGDWTLAKMMKLGLFVGIMGQFQILTIGVFLPFLVPFFIHGLWQSREKLLSSLNFLAGVLLALVLSLNALIPMLEVYHGNLLIAPVGMDLMDHASRILQPLYTSVYSSSDIISTIIAYALITGLLLFWSHLLPFTKMLAGVTVTYLILSTSLFPWDLVQQSMPFLQSFLQMPGRITLIATPFMLLSAALIYDEAAQHTNNLSLQQGLRSAGVLLSVLSLSLCTQNVARSVHTNMKPDTSFAQGIQTYPQNVHTKLQTIAKLQPAFHTRNLGQLIKAADRTVPDYVPVSKKISTDPETYKVVYREYRQNFSEQQHNFRYRAVRGGIQLTWHAKTARSRAVPVVAYQRSILTLNGQPLSTTRLTRHWVGNINVHQHRGRNVLTIRYSSSILTKISKIIGYTAWLIVFLLILLFKTPLGRWVNSLIQARQLAASK
ncbi:hypothetical protein [Lactiplantibacillus pentosus]|uniref:hypothetical protein n=1 Tax=Lactiplantibacillus pentosus TaxID=1589 RepID=UPI0021821FBF|nr:hypothetical protein [Lactiplantibacillus pentosus]MCS8603292.1 hypothetical protein [Lactiplantibacillus pentosus]